MDYFTDEFLAFLELKQDMLFHKIPEKKIPYYVRESLKIGKVMSGKFKGNMINPLYSTSNILIQMEENDGAFFKVQLRAQFETDRKGNNLVLLYRKSIEELARVNGLSYDEMVEIVLVHEFFHFLEGKQIKHVAEQLETIDSYTLLNLVRKAHVQRASEIAANAFAKEFLGLKYLPNFYDYQYLLETNKMNPQELEEEYQEYLRVFKTTERHSVEENYPINPF
ncbi:hypothetical protein [Niallia circulans]|uniref:hypothetical protein n=1 Tax=Niallia circulans TaxID=1397 RepID=UPI0019D0C17A|nr:hypothetical protein [Niallia circulans]